MLCGKQQPQARSEGTVLAPLNFYLRIHHLKQPRKQSKPIVSSCSRLTNGISKHRAAHQSQLTMKVSPPSVNAPKLSVRCLSTKIGLFTAMSTIGWPQPSTNSMMRALRNLLLIQTKEARKISYTTRLLK